MIWLAGVLLAVTIGAALDVLVGLRTLRRLADQGPRSSADAPPVSIVVAARDEAPHIGAALGTMLGQDYPRLEVIAVDDRSTDGTGDVVAALAAADNRLRPVTVSDLPAGWLGKNHALDVGARAATGDWILFTDADIVMAPDALRRAVGYAEREQLDHLAVAPRIRMPGVLLEAFTAHFLLSFLCFTRPWRVKDAKSRYFVGIGAFNLVRRTTYQELGGHSRIAMRPDDDMKLGKIIKAAGYRSDCLMGAGPLEVEWYHSLGQMIRGLEKNMFAGIDYNVALSVVGGLTQLCFGVVPVAGLAVTGGETRLLFGLQIAVLITTLWRLAREADIRPWSVLLFPVVVLLFVFIMWRTMLLNLVHGGLQWRGTFYSLRELKANRV
ncbi:MAG: glycosyltransferase [Gemmatimonadetes bacterium]|nr:glycosyltransferase [Gemmatimonadota bacterium]